MILTVLVKPNAKQSRVVGWPDRKTVIIAVAAPPKKGKANSELIKFLSSKLRVPKTEIEIVRGAGSRAKHLRLPLRTDLSLLD